MADVGCAVVAAIAAARYGFEAADIFSRRRTASVAEARGVAMALARHTLERSYPEIGRAFSRDHTTIIHHVEQVEARIVRDAGFAAAFERMKVAVIRALDGCGREAMANA